MFMDAVLTLWIHFSWSLGMINRDNITETQMDAFVLIGSFDDGG